VSSKAKEAKGNRFILIAFLGCLHKKSVPFIRFSIVSVVADINAIFLLD